uniref:Uncharacterized protein n=1 Tax=Candidatus Kentrum sp. SD TaxID=2126332 RepID=A0A451BI72_9GAMM|nr:MAG: hypothetical protein BECKSD772D_GA0070982_10054 [Candidatus Kentron sp. SD]
MILFEIIPRSVLIHLKSLFRLPFGPRKPFQRRQSLQFLYDIVVIYRVLIEKRIYCSQEWNELGIKDVIL